MYIHRNFTHPGGVSPMKQEEMIDPNAGEGSGDAKVGRVKQSEIDYSKGEKKVEETASQVQDVANVAPIAGEIIDAKNTIKDLIKGDYSGAALNAAGFALPFVPGSIIKKGAKKVMEYIRKQPGADDAIKKGKKILDEGGSVGNKPKGGVDGGKIKVDNEYKHVEFPTGTDPRNVTNAISTRGTDLDVFMKGGKGSYTNKDITKLPSNSGREMVKVKLPDGGEQVFYKSSGGGKKAGSQGEWIPYEGTTNSGWFIKTGSEGTFHGKPIKTIFTEDKTSHGVYEQIKKLGLDPWEEIEKGTLKIDQWGQGFKYGSKEYGNIAEQLSKMNL